MSINYIIFAIILIAIICIIYVFSKPTREHATDNKKRQRIKNAINVSSGTMDAAAISALQNLNKINNPNAEDRFNRGRLIQHNLLEGEVDTLPRDITNETAAERNARNNVRRTAIGGVARDYREVMLGIRRVEPGQEVARFMVNQIEDFNNQLGIFLNEDRDLDAALWEDARGLNDAIMVFAPEIKNKSRQQIMTDVAATGVTGAVDVANAALDLAANFTENKQSVHDVKVSRDLIATWEHLRNSNVDKKAEIAEIRQYIQNYALASNRADGADRLTDTQLNNAIIGINTALKGDFMSNYNAKEDEILAAVWARTKHKNNKNVANAMREAVIISLAEGTQPNGQVCANGRTGYMLNSLVLLDYDPTVASGAMTFEAYRNNVFQQTKDIIDDVMDEFEELSHNNEKIAKAIEDYDAGESGPNPIKNEIKTRINKAIDDVGKFSAKEAADLREECYTYAAIIE